MQATTPSFPAGGPGHGLRPEGHPRSLDDLLALDAGDLADLYRRAQTPTLAELDGDLRGRMLAPPIFGKRAWSAMRRLARSSAFPWRGKSFASRDEAHGGGVNRVLSDRVKLFRFETTIAKSRAGDFDAVQLDYDRRGNPLVVRLVKDEVRRVAPGLFLGQAWLVARGKPVLWAYFGLERLEKPSAVTSAS